MEVDIFNDEAFLLENCRDSLLAFMDYTWQRTEPLKIGYHTKEITNAIDLAIDRFSRGISSYLQIKVVHRHGKSDIVSRYGPTYFLGKFPDEEVILSSYSASLSHEFSKFARGIIKSDEYQAVFPNVRLDPDDQSVQEWGLDGHFGKLHALGVGGSVTGKGGAFVIIDDPIKNREEAESETIRKKRWEGIRNDILTRLAPAHIVILMGTPFHVLDPHGMVKFEMENNPKFPRFEELIFPYKSERYKTTFLFPERFSDEWYLHQEALLGEYGAAALLGCNPVPRGGSLFKVENIKVVEEDEIPDDVYFVRAWDPASSEKQLKKDDPDYTAGALLGVRWEEPFSSDLEPIPHLYLKNMTRMREEATTRNKRICQIAMIDGTIRVGAEAYAAYKDTYVTIRDVLKGLRVVEKIQSPGDKIVRADQIAPIVEAGNFYIVRGDWNLDFISEMTEFPSGSHDDQVDAVTTAWSMLKNNPHYSEDETFNVKMKEVDSRIM